MKRKHALPISLALGIFFGYATVTAQAAQQNSAPPASPQAAQPAPPHLSNQDQKDAQRTIPGAYRMAYTLTELDGTKRIGSQRYAIVLVPGAPHSHLMLGSTVPVQVGISTNPMYDKERVSFTIDATLRQFANGLELSTYVMQTSFAKESASERAAESFPPVTRNFEFTTTALLIENKPVTIGQFDIPGSTHILQIQVELTKIP